jgi:glycosyltransferase involved in cell wall biosynthesis
MRVNLITNLSGFPYGTATAKRINLVGKSILNSDIEFHVYTNGIQFDPYNTEVKGTHEGIPFEYLHEKSISKRLNKATKIWFFLIGCVNLLGIFRKFDKRIDIVYSYNHGNLFNVYIIFLCKLFKIRIVQEINEWFHNDLNKKLEKRIMEGPLVKHCNGAIVISDAIKKNVLKINSNIKLLKIPVLEDFSLTNFDENHLDFDMKYCFWMGDVNSYLKDVLFIIKACAEVYKSGTSINFYVSGPYNIDAITKIHEIANLHDLPVKNIKMLGYISETELKKYCQEAFLFIVPLWDDERSKSRFPTKIATFMQVGKPVISCGIGEIANLLTDSKNVLLYREGDYYDLAMKIIKLFNDQTLYESISKESYIFASQQFNYLTYSQDLRSFLNKL